MRSVIEIDADGRSSTLSPRDEVLLEVLIVEVDLLTQAEPLQVSEERLVIEAVRIELTEVVDCLGAGGEVVQHRADQRRTSEATDFAVDLVPFETADGVIEQLQDPWR